MLEILLKEKNELNKKYRELLKKEMDRFLDSPFSKKDLFDEMDIIENRINELNLKINELRGF